MATVSTRTIDPKILANAKALVMTKIVDLSDGTLDTTSYLVEDIIADTIALTQDDPTVNEIDSEFYDEPLFENTQAGNYTFAATCADVQPDLLANFLGYELDAAAGIASAPSSYKQVYAKLEIQFHDGSAFICPKVKLNSKLDLSSLKTATGKIEFAGTCYAGDTEINGKTYNGPVIFDSGKPAVTP